MSMEEKTEPRSRRTWWAIGLGFALIWIVLLAVFLPKIEQEKAGTPADYSWKLRDLKDASVELSKYKGKPIFLNVWATWCDPCIKEMPSIARLAANPRLKDMVFLCVAKDEEIEPVRQFLRDKDWKMTFLWSPDVPPFYATDGIPATFVISADGRVVFAQVGSAEWDVPETIERLEQTIDEGKLKP